MSSWSPTLVTNSPLAFKFISLLSKARKNSLPPRFFLYHYFRKRGKTRNFSPLHLIKTEFLVYLISLILGCTCTRKVHAARLAAQCNARSRCPLRARAGPVAPSRLHTKRAAGHSVPASRRACCRRAAYAFRMQSIHGQAPHPWGCSILKMTF